jgi:thiol-disulfide isomerase/thioredoxin
MKKIPILLVLLFIFYSDFATSQQRVRKGHWIGEFALNESTQMPFRFFYDSKQRTFEVYNASETIKLEYAGMNGDTVMFAFPAYNSYVSVYKKSCGKVAGNFVNRDRKSNGTIPFQARFNSKKRKLKSTKSSHNVSGKWQVSFAAHTENEYPAIGLFQQEENGRVTGTFLTETGDYRFLEGQIEGDRLFLSGFSGGHVFYFEAIMVNSNLFGTFYSGAHYKNKWVAVRNEQFELADPFEKTFLSGETTITFEKPDLTGELYQFPNEMTNGKVVILQVLGSWCPNCLDETVFFKQIYEKYSGEGLMIIALGYEIPDSYEGQRDRLLNYVDKLNVPYRVLVGGKVSKEETAADFPALNDIFAYPTTIFFNRLGEVVKIHTGFNGPGTGAIYQQYVQETDKLIQKLLNE